MGSVQLEKRKAFVGHSFAPEDEALNRIFLDYLSTVQELPIGFSWDHAEKAEAKELAEKVREKFKGKNLFIGICTIREIVLKADALKSATFRKQIKRFNIDDMELKTSDWIIQEIGMAVAQKMKLILLIEKGLRKPGGLQGDVEYIEFTRENPTAIFPKFLQMIKSVTPSQTEPKASAMAKSEGEDPEEVDPESENEFSGVESNWTLRDYRYHACLALYRKNPVRCRSISDAFFDSQLAKKEQNVVEFRASVSLFRLRAMGEDCLGDLRDLCEEYPCSAVAKTTLAKGYEDFEDYQKASRLTTEASDLATSNIEKLQLLIEAARLYNRADEKELSTTYLAKARDLYMSDRSVAGTYFKLLAVFHEDGEDAIDYFSFAECALLEMPNDYALRFSLAYRYSEKELNNAAYYHYSILRERSDYLNQALVSNNMGAAASALGMQGKAVSEYRAAVGLGNARAHGNLASKYLEVGFIEEARTAALDGTKIDPTDDNVTDALSRVSKVDSEEAQAEGKVLKAGKNIQAFFQRYGKAAAEELSSGVPEKWDQDGREFKVTISDNQFEAISTYSRPARRALGNALLGHSTSEQETATIVYTGGLKGCCVRATCSDSGFKRKSLLDTGPIERDALLVLDLPADTIYELELKDGESVPTTTWRAIK